MAVTWLRRFIFGQTPRSPRFNPRSVHVRSVVRKVGRGLVFLRALRLRPVRVIPPMLHIHLCLNAALTRTKYVPSLGNLPTSNALSENRGALETKLLSFTLQGTNLQRTV
jgi:hypothetical protein